jgi:broad specificity phosphatase PhoE
VNVFAIRHSETAWSLSGQHTSTTDTPLTDNGRRLAEGMRPVLAAQAFGLVLFSPMRRARETWELACLGDKAVIHSDLAEWNCGHYEGLTPNQIQELAPGWLIFPARVDRVIPQSRAVEGNTALFAHGHVLRVFLARWIGLPPRGGQHFAEYGHPMCHELIATRADLEWTTLRPAPGGRASHRLKPCASKYGPSLLDYGGTLSQLKATCS